MRAFVDWSLRTRLALLLVAASVLPLVISTVLDIRDTREALYSQTAALLGSRADQLGASIDKVFDSYQHVADRLGQLPHGLETAQSGTQRSNAVDHDALRRMLRVYPEDDRNILAVAFLDGRGNVQAASDDRLEGADLSQRPYAHRPVLTDKARPEVLFFEPLLGSIPAIVFVAPIPSAAEQPPGHAIVWIRLSAIWQLVKASEGQAGAGSFAIVVDSNGIRVAHSQSDDLVLRPTGPMDAAILRAAIEQQRFGAQTRALLTDVRPFPAIYARATAIAPGEGPFTGVGIDGTSHLAVARRLQNVSWTVFYMVPEDSIAALMGQPTRRRTLLGLMIVLAAIAAGIGFSSGILRPIRSLSGAAASIAAGRLSARAAVYQRDELGELGRSFNAMAQKIEAQANELRNAHDQLELRVHARTVDLDHAIRTLEDETAERTRAQELLRRIVDSSDDAIISKDLDGTILSWNPAAERLFGYPAAQALGRPMLMIFPPDRVGEETRILDRIRRGESVDHFETVRVRADGSLIDISATISPLRDRDGQIVGASKIARDITERKAQERKLRAQLERLDLLRHITRAIAERQDISSIFQVVVATLESQLPAAFCCYLQYGGTALEVAQVGPRSQDVSRVMGLTEGQRFEILADNLARYLEKPLIYEPDTAQFDCELARKAASGGLRSLVVIPLLAESHLLGTLAVARAAPDAFSSGECEFLTQVGEHAALAAQQAKLHGALQRAYDDLRQTQQAIMQQERLRALGQMASGIAHDINNALSPATLYVQSLLESERSLSLDAREQLGTIKRSIEDVAKTVARMRQFYRPRDAVAPAQVIDLNELIEHVIDLTRARWHDMPQERGIVIQIETRLEAQLPMIVGVRNEVSDAATNLVLNAVDAMPEGGTLRLVTRSEERRSARPGFRPHTRVVHLEVIDSGIGMSEAVRGRCLEPFFTTKGERGTGLGLAMVYGMTERNDAELHIDSAPGHGTTVRITFRQLETQPANEPASQPHQPRSLRILSVEDDPVVLKSLRHILEQDGHDVHTADGGQAGIDAFRRALLENTPFDVVITDLGMPGVDGRMVAAAVKSVSPSTPVILLTGWGYRMLDEQQTPEHVDRVLSKPPQMHELRQMFVELTRSTA